MEIYEIVECPFCGMASTVKVDADGYFAWKYDGELIQNALPNLTPTEREMLISGMCEDCQKKIFGE